MRYQPGYVPFCLPPASAAPAPDEPEARQPSRPELDELAAAHVLVQELMEGGFVLGFEGVADSVQQLNRLFDEQPFPPAADLLEVARKLVAQEATAAADELLYVPDAEPGEDEPPPEELRGTRWCAPCQNSEADRANHVHELYARGLARDDDPAAAVGSYCAGCGRQFGGRVANPHAQMREWTMTLGEYELTLWWRSKTPQSISQDQCLLTQLPDGRVRVAVIDGVTPAAGFTPNVAASASGPGINGASYAATVIRHQLAQGGSLDGALQAANTQLHGYFTQENPALYSRALPQATVAAADIYPDGRVEILRGGTDKVFLCGAGGARDLFPEDVAPQVKQQFTAELQQQEAAAKAQNPMISQRQLQNDIRFPLEEKHYRRENWVGGAAIGRFAEPNLRSFSGTMPDELVLCSDGAWMDAERLADLPAWMASGLEQLEAGGKATDGNISDKKTDDVTVIRLRRRRGR